MNDNGTIGFVPTLPGESDEWTPHQALLRAIAECDKVGWTAVVIVGLDPENNIRGLNATPSRVVRMGLLADALTDDWNG